MTTFKQKALEALKQMYLKLNEPERNYNDAIYDCISRIDAIEEDDIEEIRKKANWYDESCMAIKSPN